MCFIFIFINTILIVSAKKKGPLIKSPLINFNEQEGTTVAYTTCDNHNMLEFELLISLFFGERMVCPGEGLPSDLIQDMFHSSRWITQEGLGLSMCRKILKLINGEVQYIRESERCYFLISIELPIPGRGLKSID